MRPDETILVGGRFGGLGGQVRGYIGLLHADGSLDSQFNPTVDPGSVSPRVFSLLQRPDGKILVGGYFNTVGGQGHTNIALLNADGTVDAGFTLGARLGTVPQVCALAVQADGKILVGGQFATLGGQPCTNIARLNTDGSVDAGFNPGAGGIVYSLVVQADGGILVGGSFTTLAGRARARIGRLDADGTPDPGFNPGASATVYSLAVQTDGRILVAGSFTNLAGYRRGGIARLNADGTLDPGFNPGANGTVYSLAVQANGKILVGGSFTNLAGEPRQTLARLNNTEPATQSLTYAGPTVTWLRDGTSPEVCRTTFEYSDDGIVWTLLGAGTRIPGGWQLTEVSVPPQSLIRARGYVTGGQYNGSGWFVEALTGAAEPIWLTLVRNGSEVVLSWTGGRGPYQVQQTTSLGDAGSWQNLGGSVQTNSVLLPIGSGNLFLRVLGE